MSTDLMEDRLRKLIVDTPDAGRISARVLGQTAEPRRRLMPRVAAAPVAFIALVVLVAYFVPAADTAIAGLQPAGDLLRDAGLVGARDHITYVGATSTSSGYRLELVGVYADSSRTVFLLHSDPGVGPDPGSLRLTDQFGRSYMAANGAQHFDTGDSEFQFEALAWPDGITGARITLHVPVLEKFGTTGPLPLVQGNWELTAIVGVDQGASLPLPPPATLGPARFRFTSLRYSTATVGVDMEETGVSFEELGRTIPDGLKGFPAFSIEMFDPAGNNVSGSGESSSDPGGVHIRFLGFRIGGGGNYVLRLSYYGYGSFDRVIKIP